MQLPRRGGDGVSRVGRRTAIVEHGTAARRMQAPHNGRNTVLFVVSEDWYFLSHRLPQARAVRAMGFEVVVAARMGAQAGAIAREGFTTVNVPFERRSLDPIREARVAAALWRVFRRYRPIAIHAVALKPIIDTGFAALFLRRMIIINAFTGMGAVLGHFARPGLLKRFLASLIRILSRATGAYAIVQNNYDEAFLVGRGIVPRDRVFLVPGSGVDVEAFPYRPEPEGRVVISMVSRLLRDKGVEDLVTAARLMSRRGVSAKVQIVGNCDPDNPHSVSEAEIGNWRADGIDFPGHRSDIAAVWASSHIAVLPSYYGEGVPKSLLEAAASGRPLVTTDTPGCRDLVPDESTGVLVQPRNAEELANALTMLVERPDMRLEMGRRARALAVRKFSDQRVMARTQDVYRSVLGCLPASAEPHRSGAAAATSE